jgi:hypothetical protein
MKIYKNQYQGYGSKQKILDAVEYCKVLVAEHAKGPKAEIKHAARLFNQQPEWIRRLVEGEELEYIAKTKEDFLAEQQAQDKLKSEQAENNQLIAAKTDPILKDQIIENFLNINGFTKFEFTFQCDRLNIGDITQEKFNLWNDSRLKKMKEIVDKINNS